MSEAPLPTTDERMPDSTWWTHDGENWKGGNGCGLTVAPMQRSRVTTIPYVWAAEAWKEYDAQGHGSQSLRRLNERGGFSETEIIGLLYERIRRLQGQKS